MRYLILPAATLALLALAACEPAEVVDEPTNGTATPDSGDDGGEPERKTAKVGDTLTLAGVQDGAQMDVTVVDVIDSATSEMMEPEGRHVAVDLRLTNSGEAPYDDSPSNSGELIDTADAGHNTTLAEVSECDSFGGGTTIPAGDTRTGCVVFELPSDRDPRAFHFSLASGMAPQTGVWEIGE